MKPHIRLKRLKATVVDLSTYRTTGAQQATPALYTCACGRDLWYVLSNGRLECFACGALIKRIRHFEVSA